MESSRPGSEVFEAMDAGEPLEATAALDRLTTQLQDEGLDGINLSGLWAGFKRLLYRRGYFVNTPVELSTSLKEIEQVGEGFDLYDLARGLAQYDLLRMERVGLAGHRALPELKAFSVPRPSTRHRKEK